MKALLFGVLLAGVCCAAELKPVKQVQPDFSDLHSAYITDYAELHLLVTSDGVPFSVQSDTSLPDKLVKALAAWRYEQFNLPDQALMSSLSVTLPRPLSPALEAGLVVRWNAQPETAEAIKRGASLDETSAAALLSKLTPNEEPDLNRTALIAYYAKHPSAESNQQRAALVLWLIDNYPQADILGSSYAVLNPGGPSADPANAAKAKSLWNTAVEQYPKEFPVTQHAVNFLRLSDPGRATSLLSKFPHERRGLTAIGAVYGWMILGVNGIDLETGNPNAASGMAPQPADVVAKSSAAEFVLSTMNALLQAGRSLAGGDHLPSGYTDVCQKLLSRAKQLYPDTQATCDTAKQPTDSRITVSERLMEAKLIRKVPPAYPEAARRNGIQGTEEFQAFIGPDGVIHQLELRKGVFALYEASRDAVLQWLYEPVEFNGKPVAVTTDITVHFTLGR